MSGHSPIAPSSAGVWGKPEGCTGSVAMQQKYPQSEDSQDSMEGTASHEIAADLIKTATSGMTGIFKQYDGEQASNGVVFTEEMFEAAEIYADDVANVMRKTGVFGGLNFGVEQRMEAKTVHDESYGTDDCFLYDKKKGNLYIWDYKYGHRTVDVFENWQLINYGVGLLDMLGINGSQDQHITIHFRIVQPRAFHGGGTIREWVITASDLRPYGNILHMNAHEALSDKAVIHSGSHCRDCTARHACPAALEAGMGLYEVSGKPVPVDLSLEALGVQLLIIKRAKEQIGFLESGFEEQVKSLIRSGKNVPGWMSEMGLSNKKWIKKISEIIAMGKMFDKDLRKKEDVITPTQAIKLGIDEAVITAYSERKSTGLKIVPDNGNKVKQVFKS